ncbi:16S rRNA (guanine(527)-N(7))-methyltransferase RsmG [Rhodovibrionaceae bacterium A322]
MGFGPQDFEKEINVSRETLEKLKIYDELLLKWSKVINLIGPDTRKETWKRHFLDSAQIFEHLSPKPEGRPLVLADLGSGAGFPGLVLAILGAGNVHLIESDQKKISFLREVARRTDTEVTLHAKRIEQVSDLEVDVVTARALAPLDKLLTFARPLLKRDGICLFLKGRAVDEELTPLQKAERMSVSRFESRSDPEGALLRIGGLE